ncbi:MAG: sulfite exporter TauE/SafE family protein [Bacteroidota bacterium]
MIEFPLIAGLLGAILHVISGPDHLAAITPLAIETRKKVWRIGLFWGFGHLIGMLAIGLLFLTFKALIPLAAISRHSEQLVGIVLIGVGAWALFRIFHKPKKHRHPHIHGGDAPYIHVHDHKHGSNPLEHQHTHRKSLKQSSWTSFSIGVLHGLAGVAHFLLLLPVLGFDNQAQGVFYILGFALGTLTAMAIYAYILGKITQLSNQSKHLNLSQSIRIIGGLFAIAVGVYWLYLGF